MRNVATEIIRYVDHLQLNRTMKRDFETSVNK